MPAAAPITHTTTTAAPEERLTRRLGANAFSDVMTGQNAAGVKKGGQK